MNFILCMRKSRYEEMKQSTSITKITLVEFLNHCCPLHMRGQSSSLSFKTLSQLMEACLYREPGRSYSFWKLLLPEWLLTTLNLTSAQAWSQLKILPRKLCGINFTQVRIWKAKGNWSPERIQWTCNYTVVICHELSWPKCQTTFQLPWKQIKLLCFEWYTKNADGFLSKPRSKWGEMTRGTNANTG